LLKFILPSVKIPTASCGAFMGIFTDGRNIGLFYPRIVGLVLNGIFGQFASRKDKTITSLIFDTSEDFKIGLIRENFDLFKIVMIHN